MAPRSNLISDIRSGAGFIFGLPRFLHIKFTPEIARSILEERLRRRSDAFLSHVRKSVFENASSPYRALFTRAGCAYEDLEKLVRAEGLETALAKLIAEGVCLTVDEFKGRREARRGTLSVAAGPDLLANRRAGHRVPVRTGGSRGSGTPIMIGFDYIADCAVNVFLLLEKHGGGDWVKADWEVPGGGALVRLLELGRFGRPVDRWFSQVDPGFPGLHPRYKWSARALRWGSLLAAAPLPRVEHVPLDRPVPIVSWMRSVLDAGQTPFLFTFPSSAVRIALAAVESGVGLEGARFLIGGEPVTEARLKTIRAAGAHAISRYGSIECGPISYGCFDPRRPDDTHVNLDLHAVIHAAPGGSPPGLPPDAIFLTGMRPSAPFVMINVNLGDRGVFERRNCGCPLEAAGDGLHLHTISSFEKLTGAGMTFMDTDIIRVLDEDFPRRFGGAPTDYQILEREDESGKPVLALLIHPRLGPLDEKDAAEFFLERIGRGSGVERIMGLTWNQSGLVRIERKAPLPGSTGKILHYRT